jgi:hypothetical protein
MNRTILAAAALAATLSASPATALDFTAPITQLDGTPFTDQAGKPLATTLGTIAETALLASYPDEQATITGEDKVKRFVLATKIHEAKGAALTADEVALIKKLIGKSYNALIVGKSWQLLDPASVPSP